MSNSPTSNPRATRPEAANPDMTVAIVLNASWNIVNFRMGLLRALQKEGYEIVVIAPRDEYTDRIPFPFIEMPMQRRGKNPIAEAGVFLRLLGIYRRLRPSATLHFTPKPNLYGSLAAGLLGIPAISNIAGLGTAFSRGGWLRRFVERMYALMLRSNVRVFFQNSEDLEYFLRRKLVREHQARRIPGSGVDLARFIPRPAPPHPEPRFLLVSRLLWEKGIRDFAEAARICRERGIRARFQLLGFMEIGSPASVQPSDVEAWGASGLIEYLGVSDDVRKEISECDCLVLPSRYREGVPRTLLEGAAMGKPIVAYDNIGIRDVVVDGRNGFMVPMGNIAALAAAIQRMAALSPTERQRMGNAGREKVEREFDEGLVIAAYKAELDKVRERAMQPR